MVTGDAALRPMLILLLLHSQYIPTTRRCIVTTALCSNAAKFVDSLPKRKAKDCANLYACVQQPTQKFNIAWRDVFVSFVWFCVCGDALETKLRHSFPIYPRTKWLSIYNLGVDASHQHHVRYWRISHSTRTTRYHTITVDMIVQIKRQIDDARRVFTMKPSKRTERGVRKSRRRRRRRACGDQNRICWRDYVFECP